MKYQTQDLEEELPLVMDKKIWGLDQVVIMLIQVVIILIPKINIKDQPHLVLVDRYYFNHK